MLLSWEPLASRPRGRATRAFTALVCPMSVATQSQVFVSHTLMQWSQPPLASRWPSKFTRAQTASVCPCSVAKQRPAWMFHNFTISSSEPLASTSGPRETKVFTSPSWPRNVVKHFPLSTSQTLIELSSEALASRPSRIGASACTVPLCPASTRCRREGRALIGSRSCSATVYTVTISGDKFPLSDGMPTLQLRAWQDMGESWLSFFLLVPWCSASSISCSTTRSTPTTKLRVGRSNTAANSAANLKSSVLKGSRADRLLLMAFCKLLLWAEHTSNILAEKTDVK
mmetsp:Transcript_79927/g.229431  ORF Transcript_79927/g.229431 Transcript_79927/m.229431 type:complete len:285 (-) Transcript_79927:14-868(-)